MIHNQIFFQSANDPDITGRAEVFFSEDNEGYNIGLRMYNSYEDRLMPVQQRHTKVGGYALQEFARLQSKLTAQGYQIIFANKGWA